MKLFTTLLLFTLLLFFAFKACSSYMSTKYAFLVATAVTILIAAGFGAYAANEYFINHETEFKNLNIQGAVRIRPETSIGSHNVYNGAVNSGYKYGSELRFYDNYQLNGRALGKIFD